MEFINTRLLLRDQHWNLWKYCIFFTSKFAPYWKLLYIDKFDDILTYCTTIMRLFFHVPRHKPCPVVSCVRAAISSRDVPWRRLARRWWRRAVAGTSDGRARLGTTPGRESQPRVAPRTIVWNEAWFKIVAEKVKRSLYIDSSMINSSLLFSLSHSLYRLRLGLKSSVIGWTKNFWPISELNRVLRQSYLVVT